MYVCMHVCMYISEYSISVCIPSESRGFGVDFAAAGDIGHQEARRYLQVHRIKVMCVCMYSMYGKCVYMKIVPNVCMYE